MTNRKQRAGCSVASLYLYLDVVDRLAQCARLDREVGGAGIVDENHPHFGGSVHAADRAPEGTRHELEGIGVDAILDFNKDEGDKIKIIGHTVAIRSVEQGEDDFGNFTKIVIRMKGWMYYLPF